MLCKQPTDVTSAYMQSPSHKYSGNQCPCIFHQYNVNKHILLNNILVLLCKPRTNFTSAYMQSPSHKHSGNQCSCIIHQHDKSKLILNNILVCIVNDVQILFQLMCNHKVMKYSGNLSVPTYFINVI